VLKEAVVAQKRADIQKVDKNDSNLVLVFSSEPTNFTYEDDKITHTLFEWIENKGKTQHGKVTLPDDLLGLNYRGLEVLVKYSKSILLYDYDYTKTALPELLQFVADSEKQGVYLKKHAVEKIKEQIPIIEKRAGISVNDYLGFGRLTSPIKTKIYGNVIYYGELDANGDEHGRAISIYLDGRIEIGYYKDGWWSTGNYIQI
jgi:hypothetical protein